VASPAAAGAGRARRGRRASAPGGGRLFVTMRHVRVGLLGFGHVGRAVARLAVAARETLQARGCRVEVTHALVRDRSRRRAELPQPIALEDDVDRFFRHPADVLVEVLGGIEPARALVVRALEQGVAVVTANKSLVAAHGAALEALAARRGGAFRFEACALAGVPFIGTLGRRPLAASVTRLSAIVNGTSNFVLTAMARDRAPFAEALARAQALGLAEPDPTNDLAGVDAAEKLALLVGHLGARRVAVGAIERTALAAVDGVDLVQAEALGGAIKPVAFADFGSAAVAAFVGPAFVPRDHPLAAVAGRSNGIVLDGRYVEGLFFSGPGAGPEVTAATILDDVVEIVREAGARGAARARRRRPAPVVAPVTPWFVRLAWPRDAPGRRAAAARLVGDRVGIVRASGLVRGERDARCYVVTRACRREDLAAALAAVTGATGASGRGVRVLADRSVA
jgi:homoserine dehydrogenase